MLRDGRLVGVKRGIRWLVEYTPTTAPAPTADSDTLARMRQEFARVQAERDMLARQVDDARRERDDWHAAFQQTLARLPTALPVPATEPTSRRWWQVWR
jgi:hypothetical protein